MYEGLSSPNIHSPLSLSEFAGVASHYPLAKLWGGGSFIMSRPDCYPSVTKNEEIIYLGQIAELKHFQRNDRFAEFGAMVTLEEIYRTGKSILPKVLLDDISSLGSRLITTRATIGGAIACKELVTSFPGTLLVLDANIEVHFAKKKKKIHPKWMQLTRLLDKTGHIALPPQGLISRVRVSFSDKDYQRFRSIGSLINEPSESVAIAFTAHRDQDVLINPSIAFTYPDRGTLYSRDVDNVFSSVRLPLNPAEYNVLESMLFGFIDSIFPGISPLQRVRTSGILHGIMDELNELSLTVPGSEEEKEGQIHGQLPTPKPSWNTGGN